MSVLLPPADRGSLPWRTDPYAQALRSACACGPLFLRRPDGWLLPLDVERWCTEADAADMSALRHCEGTVLDIGCGPGRLVVALAARGHRALGIDVSEAAVDRTVETGGTALCRSVFDALPAEGSWGTALLLDGNIGIGADPYALLTRIGELLAPGGLLIAETAPVDIDERFLVRVEDGRGAAGPFFPWARLGTPAMLRYARALGWRPLRQWTADGRPFVALRRRRRTVRVSSHSIEQANSAAVTISHRERWTPAGSPVPGS